MGLTTAMYTGLSGMSANQFRISTIGNNIANVNTHAFKSSRTLFQTQFAQTLSAGTAPSDTTGGVNPTQVGLGTLVGATQKNFNPGSIETTGIAGDLAIEGSGFFILGKPNGNQLYTREGAFSLDEQNRLVSMDGYAVRGYGVDNGFNIQTGVLTDLTVPLGTLTTARATESVIMDGDLSADSTIATIGSTHATQALVDGGGNPATAATALTDIRAASDSGTLLFADGNTITVSGVNKGGREIPAQTFVIGQDGNTLGDFASWLETALGIQTGDTLPGTPGVTVVNGALTITGNPGEANAFDISGNDFTTDNTAVTAPFGFTETVQANGPGVGTSFTVYDSLGTPINVSATFALDEVSTAGPVWRFYLETVDAAGNTDSLGTGTIAFDTEGNVREVLGNQVSLDRTGTGATTPLAVTLDFSDLHGLATVSSNVIMADQDGYPPGTLTNYSVGVDGVVSGTFSNGLSRSLGQVVVAMIPNAEGLIAENENNYALGPNAGVPQVTIPGQFGAGTILGGALELSNVDLSSEFIGLITSSTGFQAASRVISTSSDMLDQLLLVVR